MELRILGPFEVCDDSGRKVAVPAGRERALLAVLLLRRGEVVSMDALVDALWGDEAPSTAVKAVQGYVSHLRRVLETVPGARDTLITQPPGYLLRVSDEDVDARRFEALAADGWRALEDDPEAALAIFGEALALWRGPALVDFAFAEFAQREIRRLEELRLETIEGRFEAMLRLGRHGAVVAELETSVAEHPLRERLRGQLMLALYRSGRQAEALETYRRGRRLLADELGLEPGADLQRLEKAILVQDPAVDAPERKARRGRPGALPPEARSRRSRRRELVMGSVVALVAVAAAALGYVLVVDGSPATVAVAPPALLVIDPTENRIVASIKVGSKPAAVTAGGGAIWVGDSRDGTVTKVDPRTRIVVKTIGIGAPVVDLAAGLGGVWAATGGFGELVRIDPQVGAVAQRIPLGDPDELVVPSVTSVGVGDGRVWVGVPDGLSRIDPVSGDVVEDVALGELQAQQIAVGGGAVWATTIANRAKRVEARTGRVTGEFYAGSWVFPITLGGGATWIGGQGGVAKVDPDTGAALGSSQAVRNASGIAYGEGAVWTTNLDVPEVTRLNPESGAVEARISTAGPGEDVVVHNGLVWVVVAR